MFAAGLQPCRLSRIYVTAPVEKTDQPKFLNMVAELRGASLPTPEQVLARLLRIEYALGRTREIPLGPRTIDLDLLIYKDVRRNTDFLKLPHPRFSARRFVLDPLNELAPNLIHPTLKKSISDLLKQTSDTSHVEIWKP
jgi:2-amino-4-hydroxy-6-hydroxymethyldihydropteridine diphosphokinase